MPRRLLPLLLILGLAPPLAAQSAPSDAAAPAAAAATPALPQAWADAIDWRSIGPANMSGRITALSIVESDPSIWYVATASGGLLKTTNNGVTFTHHFDDQATVSIGDVCAAPSDPQIVYIGTGESNPRNSVSWGNGVYRSADGGATWTHAGLEESYQIGRVVVHPKDPDTVYVAALGRLWGPNEMRGVYKTTDGGKSWEKVLSFDDRTGVIELRMHPTDPDTLLAAAYERRRGLLDDDDPEVKFGEDTGIYKTTDGGRTWRRVTEGLPTVRLGRIGLDWSRSEPDIVFAVVESERIGQEPEDAPWAGFAGEDAEVGARVTQVADEGPAGAAGLMTGDIILSIDGAFVGDYAEVLASIRRHSAGESIDLVLSRERETVELRIELAARPQGQEGERRRPARARGGRNPFSAFLGGQQPNLQGQQGREESEHGGIYRSDDGGDSWTRVNTLNPRPMYFSQIRVDPSDAQRVYVLGISLYRSEDGGATFTPDGADRSVHVDHHALWIDPRDGRHMILGNDGGVYVTYDRMANWTHHNQFAIGQFYHVEVGPRRDYRVYGGLQDNGSWGGPSRSADNAGPANWDWLSIGGGDGFICRVDPEDPDLVYFESQNGGMGRRQLVTGERASIRVRGGRGAPGGGPAANRPRFNWRTPYILSHHNHRIFYVGANRVYRSLDRGDQLRAISPQISATDRGSATALAESPLEPDLLYVGTDDGALWRTENGGRDWVALHLPPPEFAEPQEPIRSAIFYSLAPHAPAPQEADDPEPPPLTERQQGMLDRFREMDADGDGKIALGEVPEGFAERIFARADTNSDGVIDAAELDAFVRRPRGGRGGRGGGAGAGEMGAGGRDTEAGRGDAPAAPAAPDGEPRRRGGRPAAPEAAAAPAAASGEPISNLGEFIDGPRYVAEIVPSRFSVDRVYLALDGHRSDDDRPLLFVSEDRGRTWASLTARMPAGVGSTRTIVEDIESAEILYAGAEFGAWVSIDRGRTWTEFGGLPTVAVHAIAQHPTAGEIVAGTHGRSLWIADVTSLRQMTPQRVQDAARLYRPNDAVVWRRQPSRGEARGFVGENPPSGARIHYSFSERAGAETELVIESLSGERIATLEVDPTPGLHEVIWNLRPDRRGGAGGRGRFAPPIGPGELQVVLRVGEEEWREPLRVALDPGQPSDTWAEFEHLEEEFFRGEEDGEEGED